MPAMSNRISPGATPSRVRRGMMFGNNKRNGNGVASITTLIAAGTVIRGDVEFSGGLHLDGLIEGAISADGTDAVLTLSEKGRVNGEIRASNAVINGMVQG